MDRRTNRLPVLTEKLDGQHGGDLKQPSEEIPIIPYSSNEHSLEAIGADNFRGFPESEVIYDASQADTSESAK